MFGMRRITCMVGLLALLSVGVMSNAAEKGKTQKKDVKDEQKKKNPKSPASKEEVLERVEKKLSKVKTVQADFVQKKDLAMFKHTMIVKGTLAVENPGRIAWHVREPVKYSVVIKGAVLRQWDEDTDEVMTLQLDENPSFKPVFRQLSGWFAGRYGEVRKRYNVEVTGRKPVSLMFRPKKDSDIKDIIDHVQVTFRGDERYIKELEVLQADGDRTTFRFQKTVLNKPVDKKMWKVRQGE